MDLENEAFKEFCNYLKTRTGRNIEFYHKEYLYDFLFALELERIVGKELYRIYYFNNYNSYNSYGSIIIFDFIDTMLVYKESMFKLNCRYLDSIKNYTREEFLKKEINDIVNSSHEVYNGIIDISINLEHEVLRSMSIINLEELFILN